MLKDPAVRRTTGSFATNNFDVHGSAIDRPLKEAVPQASPRVIAPLRLVVLMR
jgi:hypothetical protein